MKVYNDLGKLVLDNAWDGYNTSLFAYGQTGSGKSWSIVGYSPNRGKRIFQTSVIVDASKFWGKNDANLVFS